MRTVSDQRNQLFSIFMGRTDTTDTILRFVSQVLVYYHGLRCWCNYIYLLLNTLLYVYCFEDRNFLLLVA